MAAEMIVMMKCVRAHFHVWLWRKKLSLLYNIGDSVVENRSRLLLNLDKIIRRDVRLGGFILILLTKLE